MTGAGEDLDLIDEHAKAGKKNGEAGWTSPLRLGAKLVAGGRGGGDDVHPAALLLELHVAIDQCEEGPIAASADVLAGVILRAALADDDAAGRDEFAAEGFDAQTLRMTVATVAAAAATFFMCHD
jgi:hypothetical protein